MKQKSQSPLFPTRRVITPILLAEFLLIFLVSCTNPNTQSTYTQPQQSQDIGGGCGVLPVEEIGDYEVKYVEVKNVL